MDSLFLPAHTFDFFRSRGDVIVTNSKLTFPRKTVSFGSFRIVCLLRESHRRWTTLNALLRTKAPRSDFQDQTPSGEAVRLRIFRSEETVTEESRNMR